MVAEDVEVKVIGLHKDIDHMITRPIVTHIATETNEDKEQEATGYPHPLTKRLVQTIIAYCKDSQDQKEKKIWDGVAQNRNLLM